MLDQNICLMGGPMQGKGGMTSVIQPTLITVIHAEEEFPWDQPFDRSNTGVSHIQHLAALEGIFDKYGVTPTYVMGYPLTDREEAVAAFRKAVDIKRATLGAHLHPWVTPPHLEAVNAVNSYPGNLPVQLEYEKIRCLTESIERAYDIRPKTYLAGRYGYGENTASILESLDFEIDLSASPPFDFSNDGGPDYYRSSMYPSFAGPNERILRIPHSGAILGYLCSRDSPVLRNYQKIPSVLKGMLSRMGAARRIRLSPEGSSLAQAIQLTRYLQSLGVWLFVYSLHSPSVAIGNTSYVNSEAELTAFFGRIEGYMSYFREELGGRFAGAEQVRDWI